jgi:hypothetical protein
MIASVVSKRPEIEAAFCNALRLQRQRHQSPITRSRAFMIGRSVPPPRVDPRENMTRTNGRDYLIVEVRRDANHPLAPLDLSSKA